MDSFNQNQINDFQISNLSNVSQSSDTLSNQSNVTPPDTFVNLQNPSTDENHFILNPLNESSSSIPTLENLQELPSLSTNEFPSSSFSINLEGDLDLLNQLKAKYTNNPSIGYLNINSLRGNKFPQLVEMNKSSMIDILCIDETKLTPDILTSKLHIEGYQYPPIRRDRKTNSLNSFGGGEIVYIKEGFLCKRVE